MSIKVIIAVFLCGIFFCSANAVPVKVYLPGDDKTNWEALWNETKNNPPVSRSDDSNSFDEIIRINAKERGSGIGRSDESVFLFEGDIEMNRSDAINIIQGKGTSRQKRAVMRNTRNLWPKNIPYAIDGSLNRYTANIKRAIREWENTLPCRGSWQDVTRRRRRRPSSYMYFFRGGGCYSRVGRVGGAQRVSIGNGCQNHGIIVHEIGHAMGFWHEQSRPDRDSYVSIFWNNITPAMRFNFQKYTTSRINSFGVRYDYASVMHYGAYAFSRYRGRKTIESTPRGKRLGQRNGLSLKDKQQARRLYGCTTNPTVKPTNKPNPSGCNGDKQSARNCQFWKGKSYCQRTHVVYMKKNCCKTCNFGGNCKDNNTRGYCPRWARAGYCKSSNRYHAYMKSNCAKSCGC